MVPYVSRAADPGRRTGTIGGWGLPLQAAARRDAGVESFYFGIVSGRSLRASTFAS